MKVKQTENGNVKIVISLYEALVLEKILGDMSHNDIKTAVGKNNPNVIVSWDDTEVFTELWNKLSDELVGYYAQPTCLS